MSSFSLTYWEGVYNLEVCISELESLGGRGASFSDIYEAFARPGDVMI